MRGFFFRRSWRERILLLVVLVTGVVIWLASVVARARAARDQWAGVGVQLRLQQDWLDHAADIREQLDGRLAQVQAGRSLNANQLVGQLDAVVKRHRFAFRLDPPTTERKPPVALHSVALSLEKTELAAFGAFADDLRTSLPLVNIEQVVLTPDRRNPAQLDVRLKLSSLELLP
ncbi:MAG TPA: hypothetical protein PK322_15020 [Opitutaceae bacterium]|nr:hypothetical protein [Opitutaceae bacterium]